VPPRRILDRNIKIENWRKCININIKIKIIFKIIILLSSESRVISKIVLNCLNLKFVSYVSEQTVANQRGNGGGPSFRWWCVVWFITLPTWAATWSAMTYQRAPPLTALIFVIPYYLTLPVSPDEINASLIATKCHLLPDCDFMRRRIKLILQY
jgi:hypothetical protein